MKNAAPIVALADEPTLDYANYRRQAEVKVASKRQELIGYLNQILKENPPEAEKPDLLFQKAELYLEEASFWFFEANRQDDVIGAALSKGDDAKMMAEEGRVARQAEEVGRRGDQDLRRD